jgi:uncharacterized protein YndB with AHSA1/START domain
MGDVLFAFDVNAKPETIHRALTTAEGVAGFWTEDAKIPAEVGKTLTLRLPDAPGAFDLVLTQSDDDVISWRTKSFPPQWVGTDIRWEISGADNASTVAFRHGTFADETEQGQVGYVWGQVMVQLKQYAETGVPAPVFVNSQK